MRAYSLGLRRKIVEGIERGMPKAEAARTFGIGISTLKRYVSRAQQGESLSPKKAPGKKRKLNESGAKLLEEDLHSRPACRHLQAKGRIPPQAPWSEDERVYGVPADPADGLHQKKRSVDASERDEFLRAAWRVMVAENVEPQRLAYVDEMGTNISPAPLYAYSPKGQRANVEVPRNRGPNTTLLSSMSLEGMGPCLTVEGSTTAEVFEAYGEHLLAAELEEGGVVVMDNCLRTSRIG
jgi:transposase